jgi:hypothetical protein
MTATERQGRAAVGMVIHASDDTPATLFVSCQALHSLSFSPLSQTGRSSDVSRSLIACTRNITLASLKRLRDVIGVTSSPANGRWSPPYGAIPVDCILLPYASFSWPEYSDENSGRNKEG